MKKDKLFIVALKGSSFEKYLISFPQFYKRKSSGSSYVYFDYIGDESPIEHVYQILFSFDFKNFSLDREGKSYILRVTML